jgi:hypothetical protein
VNSAIADGVGLEPSSSVYMLRCDPVALASGAPAAHGGLLVGVFRALSSHSSHLPCSSASLAPKVSLAAAERTQLL